MDEKPVDFRREELTRYSRHILLPEVGLEGQRRLKAAKILVVGIGGLGCPAAQYLAAAGVGRIGLVDSDRIELSNLQRQILFCPDDIGMPKVEVAARKLRALNPDIRIDAWYERVITSNADDLIASYDVILDASDNFATRVILNQSCLKLSKPLIYGSVYKFEAQVAFLTPGRGPCLLCLFPEMASANQIGSCSELGVIGVLPGIVGSLQASEAIKFILQIGTSLSHRLIHFDALSMRWDEFKTTRNPACSSCAGGPKRDEAHLNSEASTAKETAIRELSPLELDAMRRENRPHILIDVRTAGEAEICAIRGSLLIPLAELEARCSELSRQLPIVLVCKTGVRSRTGVRLLQNLGFSDVVNLKDGMRGWISTVDPSLAFY